MVKICITIYICICFFFFFRRKLAKIHICIHTCAISKAYVQFSGTAAKKKPTAVYTGPWVLGVLRHMIENIIETILVSLYVSGA